MNPIRTVVVDDEPLARSRLRRLLEAHPDVVVVGEAADGESATQLVLSLRPELVFLDVRMPGVLGTDVALRLAAYLPESVRPAIVFTTAHAEHAVDAFAAEGTDYLLKPIERDRLAAALRRVRKRVWAAASPAGAPAGAPAPAPVIEGHRGTATLPVAVGAIRSIEVEDGVAFAYTSDEQRIRVGEGLAEVEAALPSPPFVRVSRAAIVSLERVVALHELGAVEVELEGGRRVAVSRRRVRRVKDGLGLA